MQTSLTDPQLIPPVSASWPTMKGRPIHSIKVIHCSVSQAKISTSEENGAVYLISITEIWDMCGYCYQIFAG